MSLACRQSSQYGTTIAELPIGLWIVFIGIGLPLFILTTLTVRFVLFWEAARQSAQIACQARTFYSNPPFPAKAQSAVNLASDTAKDVLKTFPGCKLTKPVQTWIVITPVSSTGMLTPSLYGPNMALSAIDTDANMYQIKVVLTGQVEAMINLPIPYFRNIPGLTQDFPITIAEERVFEYPDGLLQ